MVNPTSPKRPRKVGQQALTNNGTNNSDQVTPNSSELNSVEGEGLFEILDLLKSVSGYNFENYGNSDLLQRVKNRLEENKLASVSAYLTYLDSHPGEVQALLGDLLPGFGSTVFFQNKEIWDFIEKNIIPTLFAGNENSENLIRIWVVGCATGEEVYSMAILLHEYAARLSSPPRVQIFATGSNEKTINFAREGTYPETSTGYVSLERLGQFFTHTGRNYKVGREIREGVFFTTHNLFKDPPFSRLDMVLCRNPGHYPDKEAGEKIFSIFHFALNPWGYLLLDNSELEQAANNASLFTEFNKKLHLYTRGSKSRLPKPVPTLVPVERFNINSGDNGPGNSIRLFASGQSRKTLDAPGDLYQKILEINAAPSILVDENFEIIHLSDQAGHFLQFRGGAASLNLVGLILPELRLDLRSSLFKASQYGKANETRRIPLKIDGTEKLLKIIVRPVTEPPALHEQGFILVTFDELEENREDHTPSYFLEQPVHELALKVLQEESLAVRLEEEKEVLQTQLESVIGQYQTSLQELQVSNRELQEVNTELHAATDELEESRHELEAVNAELLAVNQELNLRIEEISGIFGDLQNLIVSTDIATIFLNRQLRIKRYTPKVEQLFHIIPSDLERPLSNLTHRLEYSQLIPDLIQVLRDLMPITREVKAEGEKWYLVRVLPYRTLEDRIDGVVITFMDITERMKAQEAVRESEKRFRLLITASSDVLYRMNADWTHMFNLKGMESFVNPVDTNIHWLENHVPRQDHPLLLAKIQQAIETRSIFELEHRVYQADGTIGWTSSRAIPLLNDQNEVIEWFGAATNITERKKAEEAILVARQQTSDILESITDAFYAVNKDWRLTYVNTKAAQIWGQRSEELLGTSLWDYFPPNVSEIVGYKEHHQAMTGRVATTFETQTPDQNIWFEANIYPSLDGGISVYFRDITERKLREANLAFMAEISEILATLSSPDDILQALGNKISAFLKVSFVYVVELFEERGSDEASLYYIWNSSDVPPLPPRINLSDYVNDKFNQASRAGKTVVMCDTETDPMADKEAYRALGIRAFVTVPFHKNGLWKYVIAICDARPRNWREDEVRLIEELFNQVFPRLERSMAETALRENEARYRLLFDIMEQGYLLSEAVRDDNGKIIDITLLEMNAAAEKILVVKTENVLGQKISTWVPTTFDNWLEQFDRVIISGRPERFENYSENRGRWFETFVTPVGGDRFISLFTDSTMQKNQEFALLKSVERLRLFISGEEIGTWQYRFITDECLLDKSMTHILGLPETTNAISTKDLMALIHEDDREFYSTEIARSLQEKSDIDLEYRIVKPDGTIARLKEQGEIINDSDGKPFLMIGAAVDITAKKQTRKTSRKYHVKKP